MEDGGDELLDLINKRMTLNLLIQGSAQHAFLTSHHLVREELCAIDPDLLLLYDKFALAAFIQYWRGASVLVSGLPGPFWKRAKRRRRHPFYRHPLLSRYGGTLAAASKKRAIERCREKGVARFPGAFSFHLLYLLNRVMYKEFKHQPALIELAKRTTQMVWGIDPQRLNAALTKKVAFGKLRFPKSFDGIMLRGSAVGSGGVLRNGEELSVVGKAWAWPLLSHELVKGTVELICMHGMNEWDEQTYGEVVAAADRIEFEPWLLQTGAELWRQLLPLLPDDRPLAEMVMHIALLPARSLEALMIAVIEQPQWARELLAALGAAEDDPAEVETVE